MFPWWVHLIEMAIVGLVVILVVLLVVWATRRRHSITPPATTVNPALAEVDMRYARGEIDHEDYIQRRDNLLGQTPSRTAAPTADSPPQPPG